MEDLDFDKYLKDGCLYFVKYGRGAVIVGLDSSNLKGSAMSDHKRDDLNSLFEKEFLFPIDKIKSEEDFFTVVYTNNYGDKVIRTMPITQVTFEVYKQPD